MKSISFEEFAEIENTPNGLSDLNTELTEQFISNTNELNDDNDNIERSIVVLESINNTLATITSKDTLSLEDYTKLRNAIEIAVAGTGANPDLFIPSLESFNEGNISMEGIIHTLLKAISYTATNIGVYLKNSVDASQYTFSLFNLQQHEIKTLRKRLDSIKNTIKDKKVNVNVYMTKNTRIGSPVRDTENFEEYLKEFKIAGDFSLTLLDKVGKFTRDNLFNNLKALASIVKGYDEHFITTFTDMHNLIETCVKLKSVHKVKSKDNVDKFESQPLLGLSHLKASMPNDKAYTKGNMNEMKKVIDDFDLYMIRDDKFSTGISISKKQFTDITYKEVDELMLICDDMIQECLRFNTLISKVIVNLSVVFNDKYVSLFVNGGSGIVANFGNLVIGAILANYKIAQRSSSLVCNTSASTYNFTRGNVAKALTILDDAITAFEKEAK